MRHGCIWREPQIKLQPSGVGLVQPKLAGIGTRISPLLVPLGELPSKHGEGPFPDRSGIVVCVGSHARARLSAQSLDDSGGDGVLQEDGGELPYGGQPASLLQGRSKYGRAGCDVTKQFTIFVQFGFRTASPSFSFAAFIWR